MQRQRLITKYKTFEDLVRENLNKQQIDMLINVPEYEMQIEEVDDYLWFLWFNKDTISAWHSVTY